jgi:outer membrane protein assembly factor BamB
MNLERLMRICRSLSVLLLAALALPAGVALGDDWPQWMGPGRDNVWRESGILERFPDGGPKVLWRTPVAGGYSGPAVAGGRVFVTDYVTSDNVKVPNFERQQFTGIERVLCLEEATGKLLWKHQYPVKYSISYPAGPRCTPLVHEGKVYTLGAEGHLFGFDAASGRVVWSRDLKQQYNTKAALWGYAGHPLIDGNKLICIVGGEGSHVVAFDKNSGAEIWRALTSKEQGYSPPTIIRAGGVRQLILLRPDAVSSVDPETGKSYWNIPYEASNGSIIMSPLKAGNLLYVAGYSNKNLLLRLAEDQPAAEVVWRDLPRQAISPVNVQPFLEDGTLYGFDQNGMLYGVDVATGERLWQTAAPLDSERPLGTGTAFIVKQGERFWMFNELGELLIVKLSRDGYQELDSAKVIEPSNVAFGREVVWSAPAFANRRAYIRNDNECICVELAAER